MPHRDCDHCPSTEPVTHRVTPWHNGQRQNHLHAYLCRDCAEGHRTRLHDDHEYGCVEVRQVITMNEALQNPHMADLTDAVILEEVPVQKPRHCTQCGAEAKPGTPCKNPATDGTHYCPYCGDLLHPGQTCIDCGEGE